MELTTIFKSRQLVSNRNDICAITIFTHLFNSSTSKTDIIFDNRLRFVSCFV